MPLAHSEEHLINSMGEESCKLPLKLLLWWWCLLLVLSVVLVLVASQQKKEDHI